jgi:alcohol dehydrogenase
MLDFDYCSPTRFIFGRGREIETGALVKAAGGSRVLIHFGGGSVRRSGLLDRVVKSLDAAKIGSVKLGGVSPNPHDTLVYEGIELCRTENIDFVLGIGGGSAIDSAKAIAIGAAYDGDFWDFYSRRQVPEHRLGLGTVVTLPGTGSEGSNSSVIVRTADRLKRGLRSDLNRPDFSIINPELAASLPPNQVACGASDILSHIFERYFSRSTGVEITNRLCEAVMLAVQSCAPAAMVNPGDYDAIANLMWAATVAHNGSLGVGRQEDWSVHALEAELGGLYDTAHGAGLAALYPAWLHYHLPSRTELLARFASHAFGVSLDAKHPEEAAKEGIRRLAGFYSSLGLSVNLHSLGIRQADFPAMAARVKRNPDGTCGFFLPLHDQDIMAIYELAYDWSPDQLT